MDGLYQLISRSRDVSGDLQTAYWFPDMISDGGTMIPKRLLVVSDFHITSGKNFFSGRWSPTEDFFWDEEFRDFLSYYSDKTSTTLIINGDLFDFIQVLVDPTEAEKREFRISEDEVDHTYGLQCSEGCCEFQIEQMMNGHPVFFNALAEFLAKGNEIKILKGNHDIQLFWPGVQRRILERLSALVELKGKQLQTDQVEFLPWFFLVPGLLYVEHGNQFESTTAFGNFLYPILPSLNRKSRNPQLELDLSSLLVRYLTNRLEAVNQLADNIRPLSDYYATMWKAHPYEMIETLGTALRFVLKSFRKARERKKGARSAEYKLIRERNSSILREQAARFSGGDRRAEHLLEAQLARFDERKKAPTLEGGAMRFVWEIIKEVLKSTKVLLPLYLLTLIPDIGQQVLDLIKGTNVPWLTDTAQLLYDYNLLHVLVIAVVAVILIWLLRRARRNRSTKRESTILPDVSKEMREHAQYIAQSLGVKYVTFGHTHYVDTCALPGDGRYFNTGTWMGINEAQEQLYREAHQFTFLLLENSEPWLLRWSPEGNTPFPVVVVDTAPPLSGEEDGIVKLVMKAVKP